jgi:hypothetical protein
MPDQALSPDQQADDLARAPAAAPATAAIIPDAPAERIEPVSGDPVSGNENQPENPPPPDQPEINPGQPPEIDPDLQPEIPPVENPSIQRL